LKRYGPHFDPDGVVQHAPVADVQTYDRPTQLYTRTVGTGQILCELLRPDRHGRRLVRLTATYTEGDTSVMKVRGCSDQLDEQKGLQELETLMLAALVKPSGS
jgi:hypothetical protein